MQTITGPDGRGNRAVDAAQGYALLLSAVPQGPGRVLDTSVGGARLAAMPPGALVGTPVASAVHLADPVEPNTVLTHLRTAAATPGPLVVYVLGQVMIDRRQRQPHVALARTTAQTVRYTALPWAWLAHELRGRGTDGLTVLVDLVAADTPTWEALSAAPGHLVGELPLFGVLAPPPPKRAMATPRYTNALSDILRSGHPAPSRAHLHQLALAQSGAGSGGEVLFHGGRAALQAAAPPPRAAQPPQRTAPAPAPAAPAPAVAPEPVALPEPVAEPEAVAEPEPVAAPQPVVVPAPEPVIAAEPVPEPVPVPGPVTVEVLEAEPLGYAPAGYPPPPPSPPTTAPPALASPMAAAAPIAGRDPHLAIRDAARAGRFGEANEIVNICERTAMRASGARSAEAIHWKEVRADLAMLADDNPGACTLWMGVADAYLAGGREAGEKAVVDAVDRAHFCWGRITEPATALRLAGELVPLRHQVPGRQPGAVEKLRLRVAALST